MSLEDSTILSGLEPRDTLHDSAMEPELLTNDSEALVANATTQIVAESTTSGTTTIATSALRNSTTSADSTATNGNNINNTEPTLGDLSREKQLQLSQQIVQTLQNELNDEKQRRQRLLAYSEKNILALKQRQTLLINRINAAAVSSAGVVKYLQHRIAIAKDYATSVKSLPHLVSQQAPETGSLESALDYFHKIALSEAEKHVQFCCEVEGGVMKSLADVASHCADLQKSVGKETQKIAKEVQAAHEKLNKSYQAYEVVLLETSAAVTAASTSSSSSVGSSSTSIGSVISKDPWMYQLQCSQSLTHLKTVHEQWREKIEKIFSDVEASEKSRSTSYQKYLKEWCNQQASTLVKISKDVEVAAAVLAQIQPTEPFATYAKQVGLTPSDTISAGNNNNNNNGALATSAAATPHLLSSSSSSSSKTAVPSTHQQLLQQATSNTNNNSSSNINNNNNNNSKLSDIAQSFSSRSVLKSGILELSGLVRWKSYTVVLTQFAFLHWFTNTDSANSEASIPLSLCSVHVSDPAKFVFVVEYTPSGIFSSNKKYLFKARSEAEMVDWIMALKPFSSKPSSPAATGASTTTSASSSSSSSSTQPTQQ